MKTKNVKIVEVDDWDDLVTSTYKRSYCFQQQDGCKDRGLVYLNVPSNDEYDYTNNTIPEEVNGFERGVSFKAWLERDPNKLLNGEQPPSSIGLGLFWSRNFYPHVSQIINDLYNRGLLEEGEMAIEIDW